MNRNTVMMILRYSIVIMLLAICLFFWADVQAPAFVAVCLTMVFCFLIFSLGIIFLIADKEEPIKRGRAIAILVAYLIVCVTAVIVRICVNRN